ncbi:conserved hypothetical protein [Culex quinquefasciatus]|uniref:Uncharacterized protein n=1 Tax=Culex quinquefasciatus TaxID=7176 RepID=B0WWF7_CULQU|nr:conserved hypothetical protein [Culex quinquefasciatus]|eukprot:XP_001861729.1 conserved hypothetical protein [Culex quinquefasciatus]
MALERDTLRHISIRAHHHRLVVNLAKIKAENCGQEELARCARPFQVLQSSTDLSIATKKEELDKICP